MLFRGRTLIARTFCERRKKKSWTLASIRNRQSLNRIDDDYVLSRFNWSHTILFRQQLFPLIDARGRKNWLCCIRMERRCERRRRTWITFRGLEFIIFVICFRDVWRMSQWIVEKTEGMVSRKEMRNECVAMSASVACAASFASIVDIFLEFVRFFFFGLRAVFSASLKQFFHILFLGMWANIPYRFLQTQRVWSFHSIFLLTFLH